MNNARPGAEPRSSRRARRRSAARSTRIVSNSSPERIDEIATLPVKTVNGIDGLHRRRRAACATATRRRRASCTPTGGAASSCRSSRARGVSTLDIVTRIRGDPADGSSRRSRRSYKIDLLFDQSVFVRAAVEGVRQGGGDRRGAHRAHDPPLPRELAEHAHRRHLDPAVDPRLAHRASPRSARRST